MEKLTSDRRLLPWETEALKERPMIDSTTVINSSLMRREKSEQKKTRNVEKRCASKATRMRDLVTRNDEYELSLFGRCIRRNERETARSILAFGRIRP